MKNTIWIVTPNEYWPSIEKVYCSLETLKKKMPNFEFEEVEYSRNNLERGKYYVKKNGQLKFVAEEFIVIT